MPTTTPTKRVKGVEHKPSALTKGVGHKYKPTSAFRKQQPNQKNTSGWKYISISGGARQRGYSYGRQCVAEFKEIQRMLAFLMLETYGKPWSEFIVDISAEFAQMTETEFPEWRDEMAGIAEGLQAGGCATSLDEIIAWNFYYSIPYWYQFSFASGSHVGKEGGSKDQENKKGNDKDQEIREKRARGGAKDHCSAFIAVGDWTTDGRIVCAHNSFCDYIDGQFNNVILHIRPTHGYQLLMQTAPCLIWSGTDFFITSKGIIGTETTIGGFLPYEKRFPIGYRIRQAMQYGHSLDDYCRILLHENSGDYANSWLFGDIHTNEILRIELGLKYHNIERTHNGYFIGFNAPYDERIRNLEVANSGFYDIRRHQGARYVRLSDLMDQYKGKIDRTVAKTIIGDHYDVYLKRENPCSRTVCSHYDLDAREYMSQSDRPKPFSPHGAIDGMVCDSDLASHMAFEAKFGSSCDIPFDARAFCREHRQFERFCPYLQDRPTQPWTIFQAPRTPNQTTRKNRKQKKQIKKQTKKANKKSKINKQTV